jgi:broad specificity phosphatase PhoE
VDDPPRERALTGGPGDPALIPEGLDATLVLLRHGESEYIVEGRFQGQAETPLSAAGLRQAELAANRLARPLDSPTLPVPAGPPLEIIHSPLLRAGRTAAAVADAMAGADGFGRPIAVRPEPGFMEIGQGDWEGRLHADLTSTDGERLAAWRRRPLESWAPGGESLLDVQHRVRPALGRLLATLADGRTPGRTDGPLVAGYGTPATAGSWSVLVAHDGVFKVTLLTLFDLPLDRFWMWLFDLCGISVVEFRGGRPILRAHNLTEHLAPLLEERAQAASEARQRSGAL